MKSIKISPLEKSVKVEVSIPGSKSYTNRALIMAAMIKNKVIISNPLISDDTKAMVLCLQTLGIKINIGNNSIEVIGSINDVKNKKFELNAHLSGTTIRFLLPLLTIIPGVKILKGEEGLNKRPIKILVDALVSLGAKIEYLEKEKFPPLQIDSSHIRNGVISLKGEISSQYFSSLLMIAPLIGGLTINVVGKQVSKPYIDMTIDSMEQFGVKVINKSYKIYSVTDNQVYKAGNYLIEGDFSSAGYFFAIAALTRSTFTIKNLNPQSVQADRKLLAVLEKMGSKIIFGKNEITIQGNGVKPLDINVIDFPDQAQTLAVLASFAKGTTQLSGIQSLRIKETDRVNALQTELGKMGIKTETTRTTLTIFGGNPKPAVIDTYGDHRMAMAFAIAGAKLKRMVINNPDVVTKTFPNFWKELHTVGIHTKIEDKKGKIVLVGFMGSGKSSLAPLLSQKLGSTHIEMDQLVLNESKEKSVTSIFEKFGEKHFRRLEQQVAESLIHNGNVVISAGGGVVMNNKTIDALSKDAVIVFLSTKFETLEERLKGTKDRPLWNDQKKARKLFELRQPLYQKTADFIVETDRKSIEEIAKEIVEKL